MYLVIFATTSAVNVFESGNEFRNLVVDKITGELYVGAVNSIYRLNNKLGMIAEKNTKCTPKCDQRSSEDKSANVNQILLIDRSPPAKLLACGNAGGGTCVFLNMSSLSIYGCKLPVPEIVSSRPKYPSVAFMDPVNDLMVVASTNILRRTPSFAHIAAYERDDSKRCFTRVAGLDLESEENTPLYILGAIVGKFRYLFTVANQGSTVVRLCEHFTNTARKVIFSYKEMPLNCVGEDGGNFIQLKVARIFQPGRKLAKAFGISVNDSVVVGVFRKSVSSLESAVCVYSFKQINNFFWSNIKDCFSGSRPGIKNWYTKVPCQKVSILNRSNFIKRSPANSFLTCHQISQCVIVFC